MEIGYEESEKIIMSEIRAYRSKNTAIKLALKFRIAETAKMNKGIEPSIDTRYWCETCGSHSHKCHPVTGYCFRCDTDNWRLEKGASV